METYSVCRNASCIATNVNASGWCPVHASNVTLREVTLLKERTCDWCGEPLDRFDASEFCSRQCKLDNDEAVGVDDDNDD